MLASLTKSIFGTGYSLLGKPTMQIIKPVAVWTLPAGVTYDAHQDQFIDEAGDVAEVDYTTQPCLTVKFLPSHQENAVSIGIPGLVTKTDLPKGVILLWTCAVQTAVSTCWGVLIGTTLYRVQRWELFPVVNPVQIRIDLVEANTP